MVSAWKVGAEAPVDDWKRFLSPNCGIVTTLELAKAKPTGLPSPRPKTDHCPSSWPGQSRPAGGSLQSFWSGHVLAHLKGTQRQSSLQLTRQTVMKAGLQDRHPWRRSSLASGHGEEWAWYNGGPLVHWALGHIFSSRMIRRDLSFVPKTCSVHTQARAHTHTDGNNIYVCTCYIICAPYFLTCQSVWSPHELHRTSHHQTAVSWEGKACCGCAEQPTCPQASTAWSKPRAKGDPGGSGWKQWERRLLKRSWCIGPFRPSEDLPVYLLYLHQFVCPLHFRTCPSSKAAWSMRPCKSPPASHGPVLDTEISMRCLGALSSSNVNSKLMPNNRYNNTDDADDAKDNDDRDADRRPSWLWWFWCYWQRKGCPT